MNTVDHVSFLASAYVSEKYDIVSWNCIGPLFRYKENNRNKVSLSGGQMSVWNIIT